MNIKHSTRGFCLGYFLIFKFAGIYLRDLYSNCSPSPSSHWGNSMPSNDVNFTCSLSSRKGCVQPGRLCTTCVMPTNYSGFLYTSACPSKSLFILPFHVFAAVKHIASTFRYLSSTLKYECIACTTVLIRVHFTNLVEVTICCMHLLSREEGLTFPGFWCHRWAAVHVSLSSLLLLLPRTTHPVSLTPRLTSTYF